MRMKSSWNLSTAIFEIWFLVLTKPGWANETPTTSLGDPGDHNGNNYRHHHQLVQHQHDDHAFNVAASTNRDWSSSTHNQQEQNHPQYQSHQHHFHSPFYSSSNSHHYSSRNHNSNNNHHQHHLDSPSSPKALALASSSSSMYNSPHRCYVCLPPNKNSREAQQILDIFAKELRPLIPDCSAFDPYVDAGRFEFDCPHKFEGCILRIHGPNISRACSKYRVNDCKKANSVEFCYCTTPLCNDKKPEPAIIPAVVHVSRNAGRRVPGSSLHQGTPGEDEGGVGPQGIRSRVSEDDDDVFNPHASDDEDSEGSGTGSSDQHSHLHRQHHLNTFIDPAFTSTIDPALFHDETVAVAVEDPNPHTKIGISMTASTNSGAASSLKSTPMLLASNFLYWCCSSLTSFYYSNSHSHTEASLSHVGGGSCSHASTKATDTATKNLFHLFLHFLAEGFGGEQQDYQHQCGFQNGEHKIDRSFAAGLVSSDDGSEATTAALSYHHRQDAGGGGGGKTKIVALKGKASASEARTTSVLHRLPLCFNSHLCFIISLVVVLRLLLS